MKERVKQLRKTLGLNGEKFGERIGLQKNAISRIETGKNGLSESNILAICRAFRVNEQWLRYGTGEIFEDNSATALSNLVAEFQLSETDRQIIEAYTKMTDKERDGIRSFLQNFMNCYNTTKQKED